MTAAVAPARLVARNAVNAQHSTGPVTAEGLSGHTVVLAYDRLAQTTRVEAFAEYRQTRKARIEKEQEDLMLEAMFRARRNDYQTEDEEEIVPEPEPEAHAAQPQSSGGFVSHKPVIKRESHPFPGFPRSYRQSEGGAR